MYNKRKGYLLVPESPALSTYAYCTNFLSFGKTLVSAKSYTDISSFLGSKLLYLS